MAQSAGNPWKDPRLPAPKSKRALAYIRVSAVMGREEMISPELQRYEIDQCAARTGLDIVGEISDIDKSGRSFTKRRVAEAIEAIKNDAYHHVILWKWSRWGRNLRESLVHLAQVEAAGGIVRAATEDFDQSTSVGRFTRDQMLLIAQLQSDQISDSWKETQAKRRRDGLPHSGAPRLGYTYTKGIDYVPDPEWQEEVANAYKRWLDGEGFRTIALDWNARGRRTVLGNRFTPTSVRRMLDTGFAAGLIREREETDENAEDSRNSIFAFDIWRPGAHEPLIPIETWEAYKARRESTAKMPKRLIDPVHALSGMLWCGLCEDVAPTRMVTHHNSTSHLWICPRARDTKVHPYISISNPRAVGQLLEWLSAEAEGGDDVTTTAERYAKAQQARGDVERYDAEIKRLAKRRRNIASQRADEMITLEEAKSLLEELAEQMKTAEIGKATAAAVEASANFDRVESFRSLREEWDSLPTEYLREALSRVLTKIIVRPGPGGDKKNRPVKTRRNGKANLVPLEAWSE